MSLFKNTQLGQMEKSAFNSSAMLSDDPLKWPQEITTEFYRRFPFLAGADVSVELTKTDKDSGVGVGRISVRRAAPRDGMTHTTPEFFVPVIIRGRELCSLDVASDGKSFFPATHRRLEKILTTSVLAEPGPTVAELGPANSDFFDDLMPPRRGYFGGVPDMGYAKFAQAMVATTSPSQLNEMKRQVFGDESVHFILKHARPEFVEALKHPETVEFSTPDALLDSLPPTVIQVYRSGEGTVKVSHANRLAFKKVAQDIPEGMLQQQVPQVAGMMDQPSEDPSMPQQGEEGMEGVPQEEASMSTEAPVSIPRLPSRDPSSPMKEHGEYLVYGPGPEQLTGWGTGRVVNFDGTPANISIFTNGSVCCVQPAIAGMRVGVGDFPPTSAPTGYGSFLVRLDGEMIVYAPVLIESTFSTEDSRQGFVCTDQTGMQIALQKIPEVRKASPLGEGAYAIPDTAEFIPLNSAVPLLAPGQIMKVAAASLKENSLVVQYTGEGFNLSGTPVDSLPESERTNLDKYAAKFLMVTCGVFPKEANRFLYKTARAMGRDMFIPGVRTIKYGPTEFAREKKAAASLPKIKPVWLVKEAAAIIQGIAKIHYSGMVKEGAVALPTTESVDSILSLGLVSPDNVSLLVQELPALEESLRKLCSLLVYTRLGLQGVPELSLQKAVAATEEVLTALGSSTT